MRPHNQCAREGCTNEPVIKFCSESCKIKHHNDQRDRSNPTTKDCAVCGTTFTAQPNRITCSNKCRQRLYYARKIVRAAEANAA